MDKAFLDHVPTSLPDPLFGLMAEFKLDARLNKINLAIGIYQDKELKASSLEVVKEVQLLLDKKEETKQYLPIEGDPSFIHQVGSLLFGEFFWLSQKKQIVGIQTPGGTGALRVGGEFLKEIVSEKIAIPDPSWPNHRGVFSACGMVVETYPYYDFQKQQVAFDRLCAHLQALPSGTIVILHACCHNPTGVDLTKEQWKVLSTLFHKHTLFPFFDSAYQGLGEGLEEDVYAIRLFASDGHEMAVASSQSKNFGLYAERTGSLYFVTHSSESAERVRSKLKSIARVLYSNPPKHGSEIVAEILMHSIFRKKWEKELSLMQQRLFEMRHLFVQELHQQIRKRDFSFLAKGQGMFCFTGLTKEETLRLKEEFGIYIIQDGRINIAGLNNKNISYVVDSIAKVL